MEADDCACSIGDIADNKFIRRLTTHNDYDYEKIIINDADAVGYSHHERTDDCERCGDGQQNETAAIACECDGGGL